MSGWASSAQRSRQGFTLIELLVVILIIGVLVAVSAPSFLGQTQKAHDAAAKQVLAVVYKEARAAATDNEGDYPPAAQLASAVAQSEPAYQVALARCPSLDTASSVEQVALSPTSSSKQLVAFSRASADAVWRLTASDAGAVYTRLVGCPSYWTTVKGTAGLAGYWRLGEAAGATAAAVQGPDLAYVNSPALGQPGAVDDSDTAVGLDGSNWAEASFASALNPASFTVEVWAQSPDLSGQQKVIAASLDQASKRGYEIGVSSDQVYVLVGTGASYREATGPAAAFGYGAWHQIDASYDAASQHLALYVDATPVAALDGVAALPVIDSGTSLFAGRTDWTTSYDWPGQLDELSVYQRALPLSEIADHYAVAASGGQ